MQILRTLTGMITLASAVGFVGAAAADPPAGGFNPQFAVTASIIDFDVYNGATCADGEDDGQCEGSVAFITKAGSGECAL